MGSPRYMSPEQMRSARDDRRARRHLGARRHLVRAHHRDRALRRRRRCRICSRRSCRTRRPPSASTGPTPRRSSRRSSPVACRRTPPARYADVAELTEALAPFGSASARLSADRVSRVIRPRPASDARTTGPVVRTTIPSGSDLRPDPASSAGTVTVSATATAWGATGAPTRSKVRTMGMAAGAVFFAATLTMAIFGGHSDHRVPARASASAETPLILAAPPVSREYADPLESVDLTSVTTSAPPADAPAPSASAPARSAPARSPATTPARRRAAGNVADHGAPGGPAASTPATTAEPDLFDGRK